MIPGKSQHPYKRERYNNRANWNSLTKCLSANLPASAAHFIPRSLVHLHRAVAQLSRQRDNLADDQLSNTAGVAEWRVENRNAVVSGILQVDLVRSDAETADGDEILGFGENARAELCLGPDADDMHVPANSN